MSNVAFEDDFEVAALMGRAHGGCPIYELDDLYSNHWDTETLCMQFRCAECVEDPTDALFEHDGWDPWAQEVPDDIPF